MHILYIVQIIAYNIVYVNCGIWSLTLIDPAPDVVNRLLYMMSDEYLNRLLLVQGLDLHDNDSMRKVVTVPLIGQRWRGSESHPVFVCDIEQCDEYA